MMNGLHVRRLRADYLIPADHPSPETVKARLDAIGERELAQALAAQPLLQSTSTDPSVWLIRRLALDLDVDLGLEADGVARRWASEVARSLITLLDAGDDGENVIHFPDPAAYLAHFLVDLAEQTAWGRWYYRDFEGLRPLPLPAALRTALLDQPDLGLAALLRLPEADRATVLRALSAREARRVLDGLAEIGTAADAARCLEAVWAAWSTLDPDPTAEDGRAALGLYLAVCQRQPELAGPTLRSFALALLGLARHVLAHAGALDAFAAGNAAALLEGAEAEVAEQLQALGACPPDRVIQIGRGLRERLTVPAAPPVPPRDLPRQTPFGGAFLLAPMLDAVVRAGDGDRWPDLGSTPGSRVAGFLLTLKCCGRDQAARAFRDPVLRDLWGIPPTVSMVDLVRWQRRLARTGSALLPGPDVAAVPGQADGTRVCILARVAARGGPLLLLLDGHSGVWLGLWTGRPGWLDRALAALGAMRAPGQLLLVDEALIPVVRHAQPAPRIEPRHGAVAASWAETSPTLAENLAQGERLAGDVAYLAAPASLRGPRAADLALRVLAQRVLRTFAWRLPGFALSSLPYLHRNFLDLAAHVEEETERRIVRLGAPPLNLILTMAGMTRTSYRLAGSDERLVVLYQ